MANVARRAVPVHLAEHEDDDHADQRGYIKGTDFALPYFSQWSRLHESEASDGLLRHVSCGYLSTHGVPPTLLALKQHAQSLCVLIHALNPTLKSAEIASGSPAKARPKEKGQGGQAAAVEDALSFKYKLNDAFDFLADLSVPYTNDDPNHHKPLTGLANEVRGRHEVLGTTYHCPFAESKPRGRGEKQKPYANHHNLIMHANACLERLDHEFSSTGGLMSLLPTATTTSTTTSSTDPGPSHPSDLTNARNSLLGQWLHFTQTLVARMHELERAYGNALDALAGEAAIPHQSLAALGPDGRSTGRVVAFPQDRWVLANAGDDVFAAVHRLLDRQEALAQARDRVWRRNGAVGDRLWSGSTPASPGARVRARDYARGIVPVDVMTRYYRLAGSGHTTLFVVPAWEQHPGVEASRDNNNAATPTIVACPQPKFPARATELEKRYGARLERAQRAEREALRARGELQGARGEMGVLRRQIEVLARSRDALMLAAMKVAAAAHEQRERAVRAEREVEAARRERDGALEREERLREEVEGLRRELAAMGVRR
ncbi:uncharacterized protein B0H64DRAFT_462478 [Chaetomium fimeti]|uniref:Uncharacterized protein n=1 Tax=Chaetomium fimeti TaxID=1854472 RepID=A0AAE0LQS6_9PEZI|nr:hypothetical protein B0H64DRAFT_462478 [Chaetomium fimeti]